MQVISATELARNTRDVLDQVLAQGQTVSIARNQAVIAQIMPSPRTVTAAQALAGLALPTLTLAQAGAWLHDSKNDFGDGVRDPWA
jgi:antitoxin (DNA-binding transcriptional repressor) of toxin-antitoxin stability system